MDLPIMHESKSGDFFYFVFFFNNVYRAQKINARQLERNRLLRLFDEKNSKLCEKKSTIDKVINDENAILIIPTT